MGVGADVAHQRIPPQLRLLQILLVNFFLVRSAALLESGSLKELSDPVSAVTSRVIGYISAQFYHGHKFERVPFDVANFGLVEFLAEAKNKALSVVVHGNKR